MKLAWIRRVLFGGAALVVLLPFFLYVDFSDTPFLSPDETAVAVSTHLLNGTGAMVLAHPLLPQFPWLHPRSFVTQGDAIVPVGFLGLPILLGFLMLLLGPIVLNIWGPLLAISVVYPLLRWTATWRPLARCVVVSIWLSFPTVIFYAHRGLFPNLSVLCLTLWAAYLIWTQRTVFRCIVAGALFAFATAIRPVELVWMLPWMWLAWREREKNQKEKGITTATDIGYFVLGMSSVVAIVLLITYRTYGSPFAVGYWLRDPVVGSSAVQEGVSLQSRWPFGFHPSNMVRNVWNYLVIYLWPWMLGMLGAFIVFSRKKNVRPIFYVSLWTGFALVCMYGQAVYQDHVGVNVASMGNSFLRYLLPIAPIVALAFGGLVQHFSPQLRTVRRRTLVVCAAVFLFLFGNWTAFFRDDEGIFFASRERVYYREIRKIALESSPRPDIVLSERSDKIFFPSFAVASPLPSMEEIKKLISSQKNVVLYARTLDQQQWKRFTDANILPVEIFMGERESLYRLGDLTESDPQ